MKHAGEAALDTIEPLLIKLRQLQGIRERKPGVLYKKSSASFIFTKIQQAFS